MCWLGPVAAVTLRDTGQGPATADLLQAECITHVGLVPSLKPLYTIRLWAAGGVRPLLLPHQAASPCHQYARGACALAQGRAVVQRGGGNREHGPESPQPLQAVSVQTLLGGASFHLVSPGAAQKAG